MPFIMTKFENSIASLVVRHGTENGWEYAASLEGPNGPLLEIITEKRDDRAKPGLHVMDRAKAGARIVIHHNHLSKESLSQADWLGLIDAPFDEMHAHTADGTHYWARILNCKAVRATAERWETLELDAMDAFSNSALQRYSGNSDPSGCSQFYRRHVIAKAMEQMNYVEYEFSWGTTLSGRSANFQAETNEAVQAIADQI